MIAEIYKAQWQELTEIQAFQILNLGADFQAKNQFRHDEAKLAIFRTNFQIFKCISIEAIIYLIGNMDSK